MQDSKAWYVVSAKTALLYSYVHFIFLEANNDYCISAHFSVCRDGEGDMALACYARLRQALLALIPYHSAQ